MRRLLCAVLPPLRSNSRQKVTEVIKLAEKKGVKVPLEEEMTDPWLEDFLYPEKKQIESGRYLMDFEKVHEELAKPHVTLTLLHDEYVREAMVDPDAVKLLRNTHTPYDVIGIIFEDIDFLEVGKIFEMYKERPGIVTNFFHIDLDYYKELMPDDIRDEYEYLKQSISSPSKDNQNE